MSFPPAPEFPEDRGNPYAPPRAEIGLPPTPSDLSAIPVTVDAIFSRAWEIYKVQMGLCIGVVVTVMAANIGFQMVLGGVQGAMNASGSPQAAIAGVQLIGTLCGFVLQWYLMAGQTLVMLKLAKGQNAQFGEIFAGGRYLLSMIGSYILVVLMVMGLLIVCLIPAGITAAAAGTQGVALPVVIGLGILLAFAALIFLSIRISQFIYWIVDRDAGPIRALGLSNQITRGHEGQIVLVYLLTMAINIGGALACLIGLIFTFPLTFLLTAVLYVALTGQSSVDRLGPDDFFPEEKPLTDPDFGNPYLQ